MRLAACAALIGYCTIGCPSSGRMFLSTIDLEPARAGTIATFMARRYSRSRFQHHSTRIVDAEQERVQLLVREVLVDRTAGALPVAIVVDDEYSTGNEPRKEVLELVQRRLVPVRIEA